ncbi:MAG TPA: metalloregulator ArsR/SmtB family transcription factor [Ktedonosporobacter sp.]|jgi:rhodanese-related sulfurtransferase|nr:metalloregulator ArsR/SmtB family transcription factor [Ktedonosporobacter sp.]
MNPQEKRHFKTLLYEQFARMSRAMANPHRLELLDVLAQGERTVEALASETEMSIANTSQHLQTLRAARLVETRRAGVSIYYSLAGEGVSQLWLSLRTCGEQQLAEIERLVATFLQDRATFRSITVDELRAALQEERVILLDVRPREEYQAAHLPRARSIPLAELDTRLAELPSDQEVVAYCRGPYCVFADEAVTLLRARGYQARRLNEGVVEWRTRGLPLAIGKEQEA